MIHSDFISIYCKKLYIMKHILFVVALLFAFITVDGCITLEDLLPKPIEVPEKKYPSAKEVLESEPGDLLTITGVVAGVWQDDIYDSISDPCLLSIGGDTLIVVTTAYSGLECSFEVGDRIEAEVSRSSVDNSPRQFLLHGFSVIGEDIIPEMTPYKLHAGNVRQFINENHLPCLIEFSGVVETGHVCQMTTIDGVYYDVGCGYFYRSDLYEKEVTVIGYYTGHYNFSDDDGHVSLIRLDVFVTNIIDDSSGYDPSSGIKPSASSALDLNDSGETANSYIVSSAGTYKFRPVKGNSKESVGSVASVGVLWESFGTSTKPIRGDLIKSVNYDSGSIVFSTSDTFKEGNAVIAAKDASGTILWSWHIWLTDQPVEHVYANDAGVMMDRNLGATSATPGDVGALGLLYQWGRKDPFLASSSIEEDIDVEALASISWPSAVYSSSSTGTIDYAVKNPMIFIFHNDINYDWLYPGTMNSDLTRWGTHKTIYDPCPEGWRIPDSDIYNYIVSGYNLYHYEGYGEEIPYDEVNEGLLVGISYCVPSSWYPAAGYRMNFDSIMGKIHATGFNGRYWTNEGCFFFNSLDVVNFTYNVDYPDGISEGYSVRCFKEDSASKPEDDNEQPEEDAEFEEGYDPGTGSKPSASSASDLNSSGETANSYIVSSSGTYKFKPVKGNSKESVGSVASVVVLWESFGTSTKPSRGDLIKSINYDLGVIVFSTSDTFKEGNAVIAAKDASGTILWSWHIWLTDQPEGQEYYNNAGTMMDRNLGATSATPGDVGALGLLYQWGRKDPFLGSSSISSSVEAESTATWPSAEDSSPSKGNVDYATANPMTYISGPGSTHDWHWSSRNNELWKSDKTIYDPCPVGWRVPDGSNNNGVWVNAAGIHFSWWDDYPFDNINKGMNFSGKFADSSIVWYPASGSRNLSLRSTGEAGYYWSVTPEIDYNGAILNGANLMVMYDFGFNTEESLGRHYGYSVRCYKDE